MKWATTVPTSLLLAMARGYGGIAPNCQSTPITLHFSCLSNSDDICWEQKQLKNYSSQLSKLFSSRYLEHSIVGYSKTFIIYLLSRHLPESMVYYCVLSSHEWWNISAILDQNTIRRSLLYRTDQADHNQLDYL